MAFTYFFRDLHTLEMIRDNVVPYLRSRRYIHIWDAGCAMGPEPYSLAIMLRENIGPMIFRNVKIHATDIDNSNLFEDIIHNAIYPEEQVKRIPRDIFEKYFMPAGEANHFQLIEEIRKRIQFQKHDLLSLQPIRTDLLLIVCKNVLLHFQPAARIEVIKMFHSALEDGGYFVTEQTQKLPKEVEPLFGPVASNAQLFRKISN
jgi:chemotaxis protein methyltransferase CheR